MRLLEQRKIKLIPLFIGCFINLIFLPFLSTNSQSLLGSLSLFLENGAYDFQVKHFYRPISKDLPIAIVDIDDESIAQEGHWPWPRKKLATLVSKLFDLGATVIAFDIAFAEHEKNPAEEIIKELPLSNATSQELKEQKELLDFDEIFANSLKKGNSILGFVFKNTGENTGMIPSPLLSLTSEEAKELLIPEKKAYLGNIEMLQTSSKGGGFINASPDLDGVVRFSPLILRYRDQIYPSLALETVKEYLLYQNPKLLTKKYGNSQVMEGIQFESRTIPTDPYGQILIPFRGPPYSIPYISATEVLNGSSVSLPIGNKIIFIGTSAIGMGDLLPTAIAPIYTGVEIHAAIASGILDNYLPAKPPWGKGLSTFLLLFFGFILAVSLPFLGPISASLLTFLTEAILIGFTLWMWVYEQLFISSVFPLLCVLILYIFNMGWGYLFERKRRQAVLSIFGEYVPPEFIKEMVKKGGDFGTEGETKELSVLFADIRNFTTLSETMNASEIKELLNEYLTAMTQVIFDYQGTIDKYVGDMVMAFWGAPLQDLEHAEHAVRTSLAMQKNLKELNETFLKKTKPPLAIGIGINTGIMNVGDMGSQFRRAYTVIGDPVNLASRLEGISKYYHANIVVGEETYEQTKKTIAYRKLDKVKVKGKEKAIFIYEPIASLDTCDKQMLQDLSLYQEALENYFKQNWEEAKGQFQQLLSKNKGFSQIFLDRIEQFQKNPPGPQWDGTFHFESKTF